MFIFSDERIKFIVQYEVMKKLEVTALLSFMCNMHTSPLTGYILHRSLQIIIYFRNPIRRNYAHPAPSHKHIKIAIGKQTYTRTIIKEQGSGSGLTIDI